MKVCLSAINMHKVTVMEINDITQGLALKDSMDKVQKLLSPDTKRKVASSASNKTFGVPLDELVRRTPHRALVPFLVKKICDYLGIHGFDQEGLFRINGNARILEKLRQNFDQHGDADLDEAGDIMVVAGLLKLFFRKLPDAVIPEHMTSQFIAIQEGFSNEPAEYIHCLKVKLQELPEDNYNLLKYTIGFLVVVTHYHSVNKMNPMAVAIIFGPNLFRCGDSLLALKDQGLINQIVYMFITQYDSIFKTGLEESPAVLWTKMRSYDSSHYQDQTDLDHSEAARRNHLSPTGNSLYSPRNSDEEEVTDRASPFVLDSESIYSIVESPIPSFRNTEIVEKAISQTVTEQLFGDAERSLASTPSKEQTKSPVMEGVEITKDQNTSASNSVASEKSDDSSSVAMKDNVLQFADQRSESNTTVRPMNQRPNSKAFEVFEEQGMIVIQAGVSGERDILHGEPLLMTQTSENMGEMSQFSNNENNNSEHDMGMSRGNKSFATSMEIGVSAQPAILDNGEHRRLDDDIEQLLEETEGITSNGYTSSLTGKHKHSSSDDINHNQSKSRTRFLDVRPTDNHLAVKLNDFSPDCSPTNSRKPFVPHLDLTTLHEHVESTDPIPARKAQFISYHRAKKQVHSDDDEDNAAVVSPRANKLKKKSKFSESFDDGDYEPTLSPSAFQSSLSDSVPVNTDLPPSPPVDQEQYKKHIFSPGSLDDDCTVKLRQFTKRIQVLKKKIKHFEEAFEGEHGYKPSHSEKAARPEIKKHMVELNKSRKEIKKLKEEAEMGSRSRHGSGASSTGERSDPPDFSPTMSQTLDTILKRLYEKRREAERPEDLDMMVPEQIQEEKLSMQKALLHFESIHGRPKTKFEKDLMRPLYDRYRTIKRKIVKMPLQPQSKLELQTVPEDQPFELAADSALPQPLHSPIHVPMADMDEDEDHDMLVTGDFAVTQDFSILRDTVRPFTKQNREATSPKAKRKLRLDDDDDDIHEVDSMNLHELSMPELQDEVFRCRNQKKKLQKILRNFESDFLHQNGRQVQREDRSPMQKEYREYKQVKAKLKLLEALLSKYQQSTAV